MKNIHITIVFLFALLYLAHFAQLKHLSKNKLNLRLNQEEGGLTVEGGSTQNKEITHDYFIDTNAPVNKGTPPPEVLKPVENPAQQLVEVPPTNNLLELGKNFSLN